MKIEIQAYWNAKVSSMDSVKGVTPEKYLEEQHKIHICDIVIGGEVVGTVAWDGKELTIDKQLRIHKSLEQQIQELWKSRGLKVLEEQFEPVGKNKFKWTIIAEPIKNLHNKEERKMTKVIHCSYYDCVYNESGTCTLSNINIGDKGECGASQ